METQWDLLLPNLKDAERVARVKENVGLVSSGSSSHCAGTLKLGLKKAFELKKKKRGPSSVKLRCSNHNCSWYHNHRSISSIGSITHCLFYANGPRGWYYFQCVDCGVDRMGDYPLCQGCGKKFE